MAQIPKGRLAEGPYNPICRDCDIYFLITVYIGYGPPPRIPSDHQDDMTILTTCHEESILGGGGHT